MPPAPSGSRSIVEDALLDYQASPGRFSLIRREPAVLFSSIREVLQIAAGKPPDGRGGMPRDAVQQAACFFISAALLRPEATHYALLGVDASSGTDVIRERYRAMMRLMHPDFSRVGQAWPADAAARLNRAWEVLSSEQARIQYDESLEHTAFVASRPLHRQAPAPAPKARARRQASGMRSQARLKVLAAASGVVGTALLLAIWPRGGDHESLVQRPSRLAQPASGLAQLPMIRTATASAAPAHAPASTPRLASPSAPKQAHAQTPAATPVFHHAGPIQTAASQPGHALDAASPPPGVATPGQPLAAAVAVAVAVAASRSIPNPTLIEVHPLLDKLIEQLESGSGERVLSLLDRDARDAPGAQALIRHYRSLVDGSRAVKVSNVQFRGQPVDGRLVVTGHLVMDVASAAAQEPTREFSLQAEFIARDGRIFMTYLARPQGVGAQAPGSR